MRSFGKIILIGFAAISMSACSTLGLGSSDSDTRAENIGTRDDIIVRNADTGEVSIRREAPELTEAQRAMQDNPAQVMEARMKDEVNEVAISPIDGEQIVEPARAQAPRAPEPVSANAAPRPVGQQPAPSGPPVDVAGDIPPNARPGECYAKVLIPAVTRMETEQVQISEEREELVRIIPAQYAVSQEQVLVSEARQYWKKGTGPIQKVDEATGEILCLVEEPAVYKTVEKRVLVEPERPEYRVIPAQFENVTRMAVVQPERLEWRRILCETNMTKDVVRDFQRALAAAGYSPGPVDGRVGYQTLEALSKYQRANGLASRGITYETLESLGVRLATSS